MNPGFITILAILVSAGTGLAYLIRKRRKRNGMNDLVWRFSTLGTKYNMKFTGQVLLKNYMIGLDGQNRKLLLLGGIDDGTYRETLVELDRVQTVHYEKQFIINGYENHSEGSEPNTDKIVLKFHFKENLPSVTIPFYNRQMNDELSVKKLDKRARHWEVMLNKMLHTKKEKQTEISPGDVSLT